MALAPARSRAALSHLRCSQISIRHASTSPPTVKIPPESPKFIAIPQPPQPQAFHKPYLKGVLPLPRDIFRRGQPNKVDPAYIAAVTPEPTTSKHHASPPAQARADWKARQAATRRQNLREGLVQLRQRKERADRRITARSAFRQAEHERKIHAPEREDERLTNPSVIAALRPGGLGVLPDPGREARVAKMKARFEAKERKEREERRVRLHALYMNARDFIVTEEALNVKVEEVFSEGWFGEHPDRSIWDKAQFPDTVQRMLAQVNAQGMGLALITRQRLQRVAEELTGGKM
ncbi:hypothetical protein MMC13_000545 [Lambiella insularis]|nr:hypothetical protein [Lambiella insularis]